MDDAKKLADRLRKWYNGGEKGIMTICEEEDVEGIKEGLLKLIPLELEQEKIKYLEKNAAGFNERKIKIYEKKYI